MRIIRTILLVFFALAAVGWVIDNLLPEPEEPKSAAESRYNRNVTKANTSTGLSKADIAWHATNTYGFDCPQVDAVGAPSKDGYRRIICANGLELRMFQRDNSHPIITKAAAER